MECVIGFACFGSLFNRLLKTSSILILCNNGNIIFLSGHVSLVHGRLFDIICRGKHNRSANHPGQCFGRQVELLRTTKGRVFAQSGQCSFRQLLLV